MMKRSAAFAVLLALGAVGCDQGGPVDPQLDPQMVLTSIGPLEAEVIYLCKVGPAGTFNFSVTGPANANIVASPALTNGQCQAVGMRGGALWSATITENLQAGFVLDSIVWLDGLFPTNDAMNPSSTTKTKYTGVNSVTAWASGTAGGTLPNMRGGLVVYYNSAEVTTTGEGCTPGFWKQSQHFSDWPIATTTLFDDIFDNAFPGHTLLHVLGLGGGGLNALGRHAAAAYLNAVSSVNYSLSATDVVNGFNAAYASGDYNTQKNIFATENELGCPLGS